MNVHIYDTHVTTDDNQYLHFDVLVNDLNVDKVKQYADDYLNSLGITASNIRQASCQFCHSELANPEVQSAIEQKGHAIIRLS